MRPPGWAQIEGKGIQGQTSREQEVKISTCEHTDDQKQAQNAYSSPEKGRPLVLS